MPAGSRSTPSSGSLPWTTPSLGLSIPPPAPALPQLSRVRRARRYANTPVRSVPTHWHTARSSTHAGHTRGHTLGCLRQAGRPAARAPGARMPPADGYLPAHQCADLRW